MTGSPSARLGRPVAALGLALLIAAGATAATATTAAGLVTTASLSPLTAVGGLLERVWDWPVAGVPVVVRDFVPPPKPWLAGHRGVDLRGQAGQPVLAAGAGVVAYAGPVAGRGVVSVAHDGGLRTTYEPVAAEVRPGQPVRLGQVLGVLTARHTGCPASGCLHWGVRRGEVYLDPLALVQPRPVRLKPWSAPALSPPAGRPANPRSAGSTGRGSRASRWARGGRPAARGQVRRA